MKPYVFDFADGGRDMADLLGGKGANLAEMTRLGLPVPAGFTITTEACRAFLTAGVLPEGLADEIAGHLRRVERAMGRQFGGGQDPLLLSVRSGARFSMPGMMETILDIGLNDVTVEALAAMTGDSRFAWDSYRRLIQMYGRTVRSIPSDIFEDALAAAKRSAGVTVDTGLSGDELRHLVRRYQQLYAQSTGEDFPQDPTVQLLESVRAVFASWHTERARVYRRQEHIDEGLGTAVNVMAMVFGNLGGDSGTGVAFTRDPATGERGCYGDYLSNAQGEDVVSGIRDAIPLQRLSELDPVSFGELMKHMSTLEAHYRDMCDIEFTIERGTLWMLQTRIGKRTPAAAFVIATSLVDEGVIDIDEALSRVTGQQLAHLMFPRFDLSAAPGPIATGVAASPGAATGRVVLDSRRAVETPGPVVLVRRETNPDDLPGMIAAVGILTSHGGKTSHAAVVARGMGKTCVCGADAIEIDEVERTFSVPGVVVAEGDVISIDGSTGRVYLGSLPIAESPVLEALEAEAPGQAQGDQRATAVSRQRCAEGRTASAAESPLVAAVLRLLARADTVRRLDVQANADTAEDAARARFLGAAGIGLCRTEHMFLGERRRLVERMILAASDQEREAALAELLPMQRSDFEAILGAMDGLPVTIRLLDPPLHEFLPGLAELTGRVARCEARGENPGPEAELLEAVRHMHEQNPMLGLRGVRLGLIVPGLYAMQVRAIAEATLARSRAGGDPRPEIMVPLVADTNELAAIRSEIEGVLIEYELTAIPIGTMIETPRAALTANAVARSAEFFSFGTNDLTQMTWGFSRDDVEGTFLPAYLQRGILSGSPFESIDRDGVGALVRAAVQQGRARRPALRLGVCGEHGGDPASISFFHDAGLDYVSCSPLRIPIARLAAGRAALNPQPGGGSDSR